MLGKGYEVYGASRDAQVSFFGNLRKLCIFEKIKPLSVAVNNFRSVIQSLTKTEPDEIYNLAGQSPMGLSFE